MAGALEAGGRRPRAAGRRAMTAALLVLGSALGLLACERGPAPAATRPPALRIVKHLLADRYQSPGSPSTASVPTAVVAGERRPVLGTSPPVWIDTRSAPALEQGRLTVAVPVPEALRGKPLFLTTQLVNADIDLTGQEPRIVLAPRDDVELHLSFDGDETGKMASLLTSARLPFSNQTYVSEPFAVPQGGRLRFGIGFDQSEWLPEMRGARFRCTLLDDAAQEVLFDAQLDPANDPEQRIWLDQEIDLGRFAGRTVRLEFDSQPVPGADDVSQRFVYPVWSDPTILAPDPAPSRPLNVILISLDTLRADHLGCYGYQRPTSPTIDAELAGRGTLFERASAQYPGTTESHMTLLTSVYPCLHQVAGDVEHGGTLRPDIETLAEILRAAGYATGAYTEDGWVTAERGFARGFGTFVESKSLYVWAPTGQAATTFAGALAWIRLHMATPWFVFVHTYQVHDPYTPPPGYLEEVAHGHGEDHASRDAALYDGEIRYTDDLLADFLARLDTLGANDHTLVVLVADHGEHFGEHGGLFLHGISLFEELLHVPLILRAPGLIPAGKRIAQNVGLIDVAPTVLDLVGLPAPGWMQGRSLVPLLRGDSLPPMTLWAELGIRNLVSARTAELKWIINQKTGRVQAYDTAVDPHEKTNLAPGLPGDTPNRLLGEFRAMCSAPGLPVRPESGSPAQDGTLDPAVREKLRALGYVD